MGKLNERDGRRRAEREIAGMQPADYSEALERGLAVLTAFDAENLRMTQAELARKLDLPRATVRRSVMTLAHLGYLVADGRNYQPSPKVLEIASAYLTTNPFSRVLQPLCEQLCAEIGASCTVAVLERGDAVMIARALPQQSLVVGAGIGFRVPALKSALGRVLLGALDPTVLRELIAREGPEGAASEADVDEIVALVETARHEGYAYVANEVDKGFHSVAVPLRRWDDRQVAAINIGAGIDQISPADMRSRVRGRLQEAAESVRPRLV